MAVHGQRPGQCDPGGIGLRLAGGEPGVSIEQRRVEQRLRAAGRLERRSSSSSMPLLSEQQPRPLPPRVHKPEQTRRVREAVRRLHADGKAPAPEPRDLGGHAREPHGAGHAGLEGEAAAAPGEQLVLGEAGGDPGLARRAAAAAHLGARHDAIEVAVVLGEHEAHAGVVSCAVRHDWPAEEGEEARVDSNSGPDVVLGGPPRLPGEVWVRVQGLAQGEF